MAKISENVSILTDKTVNFMASSQAFHEYLNKTPPHNVILSEVPQENAQLCLQRLAYYRQLCQPQQSERQASIALFLEGFL